MVNASNAAAAGEKAGTEKASEKVVEKRRALGRGLDSLLPGPRVVAPAAVDAAAAAPSSPVASPAIDAASFPAPPSSPPPPSSSFAPPADFGAGGGAGSPVSTSPGPSPLPGVPTSADASGVIGEIRASGETPDGEFFYQISVDLIDRNPYQTRRVFDEEALGELADSIRAQGLLQPIIVRPGKEAGRFTLILGERRLRATLIAGLGTIPAIVKRVSEQQAAEMTIVENLQRQELNCIEQADAFARLSMNFHLTQQQIGDRVGMSRGAVSNYMRLLTLGDGIVGALQKGQLTYSHARLLLMVQNEGHRWTLAQKAIEEKMSVAKLEQLVMGSETPAKDGEAKTGGARWVDPNVRAAQRSIEEILGMRVRIRDQHGRGKIVIVYDTIQDFDRVVGMLKGGA
ncbi:MAG: ParB/RepB/Spo0J family partition protein [Terriglobales bacterium]